MRRPPVGARQWGWTLAVLTVLAIVPGSALATEGWIGPTALSPPEPTGYASASPSIASGGGYALAAWDADSYRLQAAVRSGAGWGSSSSISPGVAEIPDASINARGEAIVVWVEFGNQEFLVRADSYRGGRGSRQSRSPRRTAAAREACR